MKLARTVALVQQAHMFGHVKPRRRALPRQQQPRLVERGYALALAKLVSAERVKHAFAPLLHELPQLLESARAERGDSTRLDAGQGKRIRELVNQARDKLRAQVHPNEIDRLAQQFATQTSTFQRIQLNRQTQAALGVDIFHNDHGLAQRFEAFASENVALITDLPERIAANVEKATTRALTSATLNTDLAEQLNKEFDFGERRSEIIARDQIGKLYGQVNASRQQDLGITKFVWRTSEDERVRPEHEALDGQTFSYDDPPDEGLPGEPILCRCSAEPVFDGILSELDEGDAPAAEIAPELPPDVRSEPEPTPAPAPEPVLEPVAMTDADLDVERAAFLQRTSKAEQDAALLYSSNNYEDINGLLRETVKPTEIGRENLKLAREAMPQIDAALEKSRIDRPVITYRGSAPHPSFMNLEPGQVFVDKAYLSTTTSSDKASGSRVKFHITSPANTKIGAIPTYYEREKEMLLARSTALRLEHKEVIKGVTHMHVTVVGQL